MIDRPEVHNAFRPETIKELIDAFARIRDDPSIGCVLLTGAGDKAFCSGGDQRYKDRGGYVGGDGLARLNVLDLQRQIRSLPIPVIALVNGYAIGGGQVLQVVCDLAIAGDNAIFGQVGPQVGSFDAGFGVGLLARLVGDRKAKEIWFLCRRYDASQALEMGLVNHVVPLADLEAEGVQWAHEILAMSPTAIRFLKSAFLVATDGLAGHAGVRRQRDRPVLHDRRGARGLDAPSSRSASRTSRGSRAARDRAGRTVAPARPSTFRIWLLAIRPATLPAALSGVVVGLGAALAVGDALPARCRAGLPRRRVAAADHGQPVERPVRFPEGRRHPRPDRADPRRRGRPRDASASSRSPSR